MMRFFSASVYFLVLQQHHVLTGATDVGCDLLFCGEGAAAADTPARKLSSETAADGLHTPEKRGKLEHAAAGRQEHRSLAGGADVGCEHLFCGGPNPAATAPATRRLRSEKRRFVHDAIPSH
jgi:hypothetical protein